MADLLDYVQHRAECRSIYQNDYVEPGACSCGLDEAVKAAPETDHAIVMLRAALGLRRREHLQFADLIRRVVLGEAGAAGEACRWLEGRPGAVPRVTDGEPLAVVNVVFHKGSWSPSSLDPASAPSLEWGRAFVFPLDRGPTGG